MPLIKLTKEECLYIDRCVLMLLHIEDYHESGTLSVKNKDVKQIHTNLLKTLNDIYDELPTVGCDVDTYELSFDKLSVIRRCLVYMGVLEAGESCVEEVVENATLSDMYSKNLKLNDVIIAKVLYCLTGEDFV